MDTKDYAIAERDGGWIYVIDGRASAVFPTREEAVGAAEAAANRQEKREAERDLVEGLEETFPASDPVAATSISHAGKPRND